MGKYKKKLRAEKAKVKLKKKLPKGQNVIDTTFKVKKIITTEQLRKVDDSLPVSSWKVPIKDLLIQLGHHNKSSRLNALNGIKEIITNYSDTVKGPLLKNVVVKVLELIGDIESKVRAAAVSLLQLLFSQLNSTEISTFYEILNIHLACAMTHRQVAIQKDSLKLADIIIQYAPEAIRQNFKIIAVNFIRILSSYKYGAQSEVFLTKGSKKDLEENRIAIFKRLNQILNICYPTQEKAKEEVMVLHASESKGLSKRMLNNHYRSVADLSDIYKSQGALFNQITSDDYSEDFKLLVAQILPLLFETWAEFSPHHDNNGFIEECALKESTAKLLNSILEIIIKLFETSLQMENKVVQNMFHSSYGQQFVRLFLSSFPYLPSVSRDKRTPSDPSFIQDESAFNYYRSYHLQNLNICYLVFHMGLKITNNLRKILDNYVLNALSERNTKCEEILSKIVEVLVFAPPKQNVKELREAAVKAYKLTTNHVFRKNLLDILSRAATDNRKPSHFDANEYLNGWTIYLVKALSANKIHFDVLSTLSAMIQRKIGEYAIKEVEKNFMEILQNIASVEIEGSDQIRGRKLIANILFWCDNSIIDTAIKSGILEKDGYPDEIRAYLKKIFHFKLKPPML